MKRAQDLLAEYGNRYMVCEAPGDPAAFAAATSCGSSFAYGLQKHIVHSVKLGRTYKDLPYLLRTMPVDQMGTMLANHDFDAGARLQRTFAGDAKSYKIAAATLFTLPGRPFIYYGEEIGLGLSDQVQQNDQAIRGPMAWSAAEPNGGFTKADKPFRPLVSNWKTNNVAVESADPNSLLAWYRALIALRKAEPALSVGSFKPLSARDDPVFAFEREHDGTRLLVLVNYAFREIRQPLPEGFDAARWKAVFPAAAQPQIAARAGTQRLEVKLGPQQVLVLKSGS
jgi:glycosidase